MTPAEKAEELVEKFLPNTLYPKQCALIAVEEILKICPAADAFNPYRDEDGTFLDYWLQVKTEIEKL